MATPIPPTEADAHIAVLLELAAALEKSAVCFGKASASKLGTLYLKRAAAIRWLLAETAHGVDETEIVT